MNKTPTLFLAACLASFQALDSSAQAVAPGAASVSLNSALAPCALAPVLQAPRVQAAPDLGGQVLPATVVLPARKPAESPVRALAKEAVKKAILAGWISPKAGLGKAGDGGEGSVSEMAVRFDGSAAARPMELSDLVSMHEALPSIPDVGRLRKAGVGELLSMCKDLFQGKPGRPTDYLEQRAAMSGRKRIDAALKGVGARDSFKDDKRLRLLTHAHGHVTEAMAELREAMRVQGREVMMSLASVPLDGALDIGATVLHLNVHKGTAEHMRKANAAFEQAGVKIKESIGKDGEIEFPKIWKNFLGPVVKVADMVIDGPYLGIFILGVMSKEIELTLEAFFNAEAAARRLTDLWIQRAVKVQASPPAKK
jgi:hypothetical protein